MDYEVIFYVSGSVLAVSAVLFSFAALKWEKFPGRVAPVVAVWFVAMVGVAATFAVLHSQHEEEQHEEEVGLPAATKESEQEEAQ
ncbi:MAG TPA: hypothetical protein VFC52_00120 [Solirubrobacterales bacterium]|nr:hypothetical protein [Solirubrobacterales bacterium]